MASKSKSDYWLSSDGQTDLLRMIDVRSQKPNKSLDMFDYMSETKAMLSSTGPSGDEEWVEVELTADTGACDTVMPRSMARTCPYNHPCSPSAR